MFFLFLRQELQQVDQEELFMYFGPGGLPQTCGCGGCFQDQRAQKRYGLVAPWKHAVQALQERVILHLIARLSTTIINVSQCEERRRPRKNILFVSPGLCSWLTLTNLNSSTRILLFSERGRKTRVLLCLKRSPFFAGLTRFTKNKGHRYERSQK